MSSRFISLIVIAVLIVAANVIVGYRLFTPVPEPAISPSPAVETIVDETELIKQAVYERTGLTPDQAEISITNRIASHAKGMIKEYEAVGGAYWLAAKTDAGWIGVYDGQSQPDCVDIDAYGFPADMVPECLNTGGTVVSR